MLRYSYLSRIRRVKCDERKPGCNRCISTGRKCDGYSASLQKVQRSEHILFLPPSPTTFTCSRPSACASQSRRSFQLFTEKHAPMLLDFGTAGFWNIVVLQASRMEEGIKHLVIAASSLHGSPHSNVQPNEVTFLAHNCKALRLLGHSQDPNIVIIPTACVLLALCDELRGDSDSAQRHICMGQRIITADGYPNSPYWRHNIALNEVISSLSRLVKPRPATTSLMMSQTPNVE